MGIDIIEFEMELEDEFGIRFTEEEQVQCRTIGALVDAIVAKGIEHDNPAVTVRQRTSRRVRVVASRQMNWPYRECQESLLLEHLDAGIGISGNPVKRSSFPFLKRDASEMRLTRKKSEESK